MRKFHARGVVEPLEHLVLGEHPNEPHSVLARSLDCLFALTLKRGRPGRHAD